MRREAAVKYGTDWKEVIAPDEEAQFQRFSDELAAIQRDRDAKYGEKARALHRKQIAGLAGTFTVRPDLAEAVPAELHVGPFKPGARYEAFVRLSNGTWDRASDRAPDLRAFSFKLVGVAGKKALTGTEEPRTQDFLMIHTPIAPAGSVDEFIAFARIAATGSRSTLPLRLMWNLGPLATLRLLRKALPQLAAPFHSFEGARFYSATPYRFGPTAARWSLVGPGKGPAVEPAGRDYLSESVRRVVRDGIAWDFQAQLYQDEARTSIEANDREWKPDDAPFLTLGRLEVPPTDLDSPEGKALSARVEAMSFDPWHACEELRPLGAFNRARKVAYFASTTSRGATPEP